MYFSVKRDFVFLFGLHMGHALEFRKIALLHMKKLPHIGFKQEQNTMTLLSWWNIINPPGNME